MSLDSTRVMVTGGTSGLDLDERADDDTPLGDTSQNGWGSVRNCGLIGRAMAAALIDAGARVIITSRDEARAEATARELGPAAVGLQLDVRDESSVQVAVDRVYQRVGGVDMLVNNAGIGMRTPCFRAAPPRRE